MGEKASDTLKEIEAIRGGLDSKLVELEGRLPRIVRIGRRAAIAAVGGGAGGSVLWFVVRRRLGSRASARKGQQAPAPAPVLPPGLVPAAVAIAAIWAGVRIYEARMRGGRSAGSRPSILRGLSRTG